MHRSFTVFAALCVASLAATPFVITASNALATPEHSDRLEMPAVVTPIEVVTVPASPAAETCLRKVRVVYSGYGSADACRR